mmetsp:Transcript_63056/g.98120  ORF Transcript_63056/g.98120 Transcript_63056/m.98120 type:complete len:263 (-) Transcript_63056:1204-1992(-)
MHSKKTLKRSAYTELASIPAKLAASGYKNSFRAMAVPEQANSNAVIPSLASNKSWSLVKASRWAATTAVGEDRSCLAIALRAFNMRLSPMLEFEAKYDDRTRFAASSTACALKLVRAFGADAVSFGVQALESEDPPIALEHLWNSSSELWATRRWIARTTPCRTKSSVYGVGCFSSNSCTISNDARVADFEAVAVLSAHSKFAKKHASRVGSRLLLMTSGQSRQLKKNVRSNVMQSDCTQGSVEASWTSIRLGRKASTSVSM